MILPGTMFIEEGNVGCWIVLHVTRPFPNGAFLTLQLGLDENDEVRIVTRVEP